MSKRLYRFLDKNFWYKARVQLNLFTLAHEKIGISRNYKFASSLKQHLDPAIEELVNLGFLSKAEYSGRGEGTEVAFYAARGLPKSIANNNENSDFGTRSVSQAAPAENSLESALQARGIGKNQAHRLVENRTPEQAEKIEHILKYYDHLSKNGSLTNPQGFLYRAIEQLETFMLPKGFGPAPKPVTAPTAGKTFVDPKAVEVQLRHEYEHYITTEARRLQAQMEPTMLSQIRLDIEDSLKKLKSLISAERFADTVTHGVEQRISKLFALPSFEEWKKNSKGRR